MKRSKPRCKIVDHALSHLCWKSHSAFRQWKEAGRSRSGPLFEERKHCKKAIKSHLNQRNACTECKQIQKCDEIIKQNHPHRFRSTYKKIASCSKLLQNNTIVTDTNELLQCWVAHFSSLGLSQCESSMQLSNTQSKLSELEIASLTERD